MAAERVVADFEGRWQLARRIVPTVGAAGRFEGQATWRAAKGGLAYAETGMLTLEGATPMHAERQYFWDAELNVFFDDGRFFHQVPRAGGAASHWCDPDQYDVRYDFTDWPRFSVKWRVVGPRKDYVMHSEYAPAG